MAAEANSTEVDLKALNFWSCVPEAGCLQTT